MKALAIPGRDQVPALCDVPDPTPGPGAIRIGLEAASLNGFDLAVAAGYVWDAMPHEFPVVLGRDVVGRVESLGADVPDFKVGDRVAAVLSAGALGPGTAGEFVVVPAADAVSLPDGLEPEQAACVGLAGIAALDVLNSLSVRDGDAVLVSGASGGVGCIAVQLAASRGARVIATAHGDDQETYVRSLGATDTVDHTGDVPAAVRALAPGGVDKALHAAGDAKALAETLRPGGRLASLLGATTDQVGRDDVTVASVQARSTPDKLAGLLEQVADGRVRVHVSGRFPLARADEALEAFGRGKLGKVLITA